MDKFNMTFVRAENLGDQEVRVKQPGIKLVVANAEGINEDCFILGRYSPYLMGAILTGLPWTHITAATVPHLPGKRAYTRKPNSEKVAEPANSR